VAESDPSLAWLLLVSSVEGAANQWKKSRGAPEDRLRAAKPELAQYCDSLGVDGLLSRVASEFADSLGATKKFVDFLIAHLPSPPDRRPPEGVQVRWEPTRLESAFRTVYVYRSKALHEGIPFPAPMCEPPHTFENSAAPAEIPIGLASSSLGGVWRIEDTPMLLHTFEYLARGAIVAWWRSLKV
jgi:hypothetical protein